MESRKPIYCFKVNQETGTITKTVITEYTERSYYRTVGYQYVKNSEKGIKTRYDFKKDSMDKYLNGKLYSFNPDENAAYRRIVDTLFAKEKDAQHKLNRYQDIRNRIINARIEQKRREY